MTAKPVFGKRKPSFVSGGKIGGKAKRCWICLACGHCHDTMPGKKNGPRICHECGGLCRFFQSQAEARRFAELRLLQANGFISGLICQPAFPLVVNGVSLGRYMADFSFIRRGETMREFVDVKGNAQTEISDLRRRLAEAIHGVTITIVKR